MRKRNVGVAAFLMAICLSAVLAPADAGSNMERNTRSGTNNGEGAAFESASPGIAAQARWQGQRGWGRHHRHHHHHRGYGY